MSSYEQPILPNIEAMDLVSIDPSLWRLDPLKVGEQQDTGNDQTVTCEYVVSRLYPDHKLGLLLKCWFEEMEIFYPCIDRADFYERLSALFIEHCTCRNDMTTVPQEPRHLYLAALTCAMVSVAVYIGGGAEPHSQLEEDDYYRNNSISWYLESQRLLGCIPNYAREPNFDLLSLQVVAVLFMTILENKAQVAQAMALAVELAYALQLNDESAWLNLSTRQKEHRRLQWWTVYHLDRRVALSVGRPILIRESEFSVEEYTAKSFQAYTRDAERLIDQDQRCMLQWVTPSARTSQWFDYLQFLLSWDKLVAQVWDDLFSLRAVKQPDVVHVSRTDKLLTRLQNNLPPSLEWNYKSLPLSMQLGVVDRMFRLRLIVFETINMLRLLIRSSSSNETQLEFQQAQESAQITEGIASNTIDSVTSYLRVRQRARPWATYGSLLLVEATSHVALLLKSRRSSPTETTYKLIDSIIQAHDYLESIDIKVSRGAAQRLAAVLDNVSDIFTAFSSNTLDTIYAPVDFGMVERSCQDDQAQWHDACVAAAPALDEFWSMDPGYDFLASIT